MRKSTVIVLTLSLLRLPTHAEFNTEVKERVLDQISNFMSPAVDTNLFLANFRYSGGFPNDLLAPDRDTYLTTNNALPLPLIYYGLEDGSITGFVNKGGSHSSGYYREPGNSGYNISDKEMEKHLKSCINMENGEPMDCLMNPGDEYIRCIENCGLELCPDEDSNTDCTISDNEPSECDAEKKYCIQYEIATVKDNERLGFIPMTYYCHDIHGHFVEEEGSVVKVYIPSTHNLAAVIRPDGSSRVHTLGNCYHTDGKTLVNRRTSGAYAYCGSDGKVCNNTFVGGYESVDYDPRYRKWYIKTKELQKVTWMEPHPFFDLGLGVTATHPIYDQIDGKSIFAGVLAVDYRFENIVEFLVESYGDTRYLVVVYEEKEPNYIIGLSTGTPASMLVRFDNTTEPCADIDGRGTTCKPVRCKMSELKGSPKDNIIVRSFERHVETKYPEKSVVVRESESVDSDMYVSESVLFKQPDTNLEWRIFVTSPGEKGKSDTIDVVDDEFWGVLAMGSVGLVICSIMLGAIYSKRKKRAVVYADWRFTCYFILGAALFNTSTWTLVGPNTNSLCMLRMWSFHFLFVVMVAPLFVKIWRMWMIVGQTRITRISITNAKTAIFMVPMLAAQIVILLTISLVDPPHQDSEIETNGDIKTLHILCVHKTQALFITEIIYEAGLVLVGCILAYRTWDMDARFGESKQLIFAMYNIAVVGMIFFIVMTVADITPNGKKVLRAIGVLWVTVFSSAAFAIPVLLEVRAGAEAS